MAEKFKVKLDFEGFDKIVAAPKWMDKLFSKTQKYNKALEKTKEENIEIIKLMKKQDAGATSVWMTQKKMAITQKLMSARNPWPMLIRGAKGFGLALKTTGIGLILAALTGIAAISKKVFDFNLGGMKTGFFQIFGKLKQSFGIIMKKFYNLVRALDPVLKPITKFFVDVLMKGIDNFMGLFNVISKSMGGMEGIKNIVGELMGSFKDMWVLLFKAFGEISEGMGGSDGVGNIIGDLIKKAFNFLGVMFKLIGAVVKLLSKMGAFKAIGFIFKVIAKTVGYIYDIISWIIEKITMLFDTYGKYVDWAKGISDKIFGTDTAKDKAQPIQSSNQNQTNNNVTNNANMTVHTQNMTSQNAQAFGNIMSRQLQLQSQQG